jgi:arylsulfatase A-like enzyme
LEGPRFESGAIAKYSPNSPYAGTRQRKTRSARVQEYRGCITAMDKAIGSILDFLDDNHLTNNTIVIFFSDNGGSGSADNGPLRGRKGDTWEGGIRVPCLVRWPGVIPAGTVCDEFLTSLEIVPTLAAACGFTVPSETMLDGYNMLPVLQHNQPSPRERMFWKRRDSWAARIDTWKYVRMNGKEYLFNLATDIGEQNDLSASRPEQLAKMKSAFSDWQRQMEAAEPRRPFRDF